MREYIGKEFGLAKSELESKGYEVREVENTADDRHRYDTTLVVRVKKEDNIVYLTTSKFALKTE